MKILYIHQFFKTPSQPGGTRSYWIAQELIKSGFEVTMISSSLFTTEKKTIRNEDGINVIYLDAPYRNEMGIFRRFTSFIQFMLRATRVGLKQKDIDLVFATSTPLTVGFPALLLKSVKRIPFIFEVRDLWPEVPIQMGGLKNPVLKKIAISFERYIYKRAKHIIALSPGMKEGVIKAGISPKKISMIPNMAKVDKFWPREINKDVLKKYSLNPSTFKVIHFGSMNIANGLDYILNAVVLLNEQISDNSVDFIFLGDGRDKDRCIDIAKKKKLNNVHFFGKVPMDVTSEFVNLCHVSLVPFLNLPILATNSPNKLFDSLSAGKPIIVNSNGWTKEMVEKYNIGAYVNPEKPGELANLIVEWKRNPELVQRMGKNARKLADDKFDKSILCKNVVEVVDNIIKNI